MGNSGKWDLARQWANVVGALFQVGMTTVAGAAISEVTDERTPLIEPALYAFTVWGLIFTLSLVYAVYQALPANREDPLLRRIGWYTAGAFACTGLWSVFVPERQLLLALAMLAAIFVCLAFVYRRVVDAAGRRVLDRGERWLVALPVGVFLGWITAANLVSLSAEAVRLGLVGSSGGAGEAVLGAALLLLGGALAAAVVLAGKAGPVQGYLAYGATVLWALVAVVVQQYDTSVLTTGAALVAAVTVVLALFRVLRGGWQRREGHGGTQPDIAV